MQEVLDKVWAVFYPVSLCLIACLQHGNSLSATTCRFAVQKGYWEDGFVQFFCRSTDRKSPEINRGEAWIFAKVYYHAHAQCIVSSTHAPFIMSMEIRLKFLIHQASVLCRLFCSSACLPCPGGTVPEADQPAVSDCQPGCWFRHTLLAAASEVPPTQTLCRGGLQQHHSKEMPFGQVQAL